MCHEGSDSVEAQLRTALRHLCGARRRNKDRYAKVARWEGVEREGVDGEVVAVDRQRASRRRVRRGVREAADQWPTVAVDLDRDAETISLTSFL